MPEQRDAPVIKAYKQMQEELAKQAFQKMDVLAQSMFYGKYAIMLRGRV